ncbi:MAG: glycosyltransferase family 2 protein [Porphyromonas sp.]|nr:glycosyltransferase family 2 protein [Porphyromonas sp.]
MQGKSIISVITVCYNAEKELPVTLRSVSEQDYPYIEYIVVDGDSRDGTMELLHQHQSNIDVLISEKDTGIYDAMNKGIRAATGDYLCFMNAGDTFHAPDTLSRVFERVGERQPDVLYGETVIVDDQRRFVRNRRLRAPQSLTKRSFLSGMMVCHQSFYAKRSVAPLYDLRYRFSSDYDWCLNILDRTSDTFNTDLILTDYLSEGATTRHHRASLKERFRIMRKHFGWLPTLWSHLKIAVRLIYLR